MSTYFTDREYGARAPSVAEIDDRVWAALRSLIRTRVDDASFGRRFPELCTDGAGAFGCDEQSFGKTLMAEIPWIEWPLPTDVPTTPVVMDLLEFCARSIGEPIERDYHSFFRHHHLKWDREAGQEAFVGEVNLLFRRNAIGFELTSAGEARRLMPAPVADAIGWPLFRTGDAETDNLFETARRRFLMPKPEDRQDALEKLWDGFERLKTLEPGTDKRAQADALLDRAAPPGSGFRRALGREAMELTTIGNCFRIRHSETTQETLTTTGQVDYLFTRMFAFIRVVLQETNRGG